MGIDVRFICLKCGSCCRNLIRKDGKAGLMLHPEEIKLFQKKDIKPCLAAGKSFTHASFKIYTYQLTKKICPHAKDNLCTIYEERPLSCIGYPFVLTGDWRSPSTKLLVDIECLFIQKFLGDSAGRAVFFPVNEEIKAKGLSIEKLQAFHYPKNRKIKKWAYNLKTEKWGKYV